MVIPSFDRPETLCSTTLTLLRCHEIPMDRVAVFVSPTTVQTAGVPEWYRYVRTLKKQGFGDVHVVPGGHGLEQQMEKAFEWVGTGYAIVMSDFVKNIMESATTSTGAAVLRPVPHGSLKWLWEHGAQVLTATGCRAWSVNPSHNAICLKQNIISRRLGLLDGNMTGIFLQEDSKSFKVTPGHGLIYDVEFSAALWSQGYRFVRYMGLCCDHPYRGRGGQATLWKNPTKRQLAEDKAIKAAAKKFPTCLKWHAKPKSTLRVMQYTYLRDGDGPVTMVRRGRLGRPPVYNIDRPSSSAQRTRRMRARK